MEPSGRLLGNTGGAGFNGCSKEQPFLFGSAAKGPGIVDRGGRCASASSLLGERVAGSGVVESEQD